ncbi:branched-chain-amino-acid aminotransferase, cytosolic isoform X2 [Parasteatoda tepidariorum]|uniref:Branched-chain-amino-acid aminotransferase n=1 Tax=Parasteatoda tepidariorum TaxID=114398 RepID=A0A2L2Y766_PARTP|nr:branched-chain-amino-acid aminotransferase, cytosolic isoform X1 [Parasteatoda tepidariorum]
MPSIFRAVGPISRVKNEICLLRNLYSLKTAKKSTFKFSDLQINYVDEKKKSPKPDENNLLFGKVFSDHMLEIEWSEENGWGKPIIGPIHNLNLHPACKVFHYAQELFEGLKAYRSKNDKILLFRPDLNIKRLLTTAERASFPVFDENEFLKCLKKLVSIDKTWVPHKKLSSLYIRPTFIGIEPSLGIGSSKKALLFVITGPVGSYYEIGEEKPVSLLADPSFVRAWPGGVGSKKMGCNYAPTLYVQKVAEKQNFQQVLWLFGEDHQLAEVGTMNIFVYLINSNGDHELITPPLDGTILPGITRQSLLDLANKWGEFKVSERNITMKEIILAKRENRLLEMFGSGTACVVSPVGSISYLGNTITIPTIESAHSLHRRFSNELINIQYGNIKSEWSVPVD